MANEKDIAKVLRKLEYGVYVVSMGKGTAGNAFTASWLTQVSSEPPMVAIAVKNSHQSTPLLKEHNAFLVNIVDVNQEGLVKTYFGPAESGYDKLKGYDIEDSPGTGSPMIRGAVGYLDCKIVNTVPAGNHTVFIGEVVAAKYNSDDPILTTTSTRLIYTG